MLLDYYTLFDILTAERVVGFFFFLIWKFVLIKNYKISDIFHVNKSCHN